MRRRLQTSVLMLLAVSATACDPANMAEHDYRISHPLTAQQQLAVATFDGPVLTEFDQTRLKRLAAESLRRGSGKIQITLTAKPGEEDQSQAFGSQVLDVLKHEGVTDIGTTMLISATSGQTAEVRIPVWTAVVPNCGTFERGISPDPTNAPNSNWGCSIQRNSALMLQNPADLVRARESSGRDANRATDVLNKYGLGQATGSASETKTTGSASTVGGTGTSN